MTFEKFADLMEGIGYRQDEPVAPVFILNKKDLREPIFEEAYSKTPGLYRVVSIWNQEGEVAFMAKRGDNGTRLYPFHKAEIDFLAERKKFRKG